MKYSHPIQPVAQLPVSGTVINYSRWPLFLDEAVSRASLREAIRMSRQNYDPLGVATYSGSRPMTIYRHLSWRQVSGLSHAPVMELIFRAL